MSFSLRSKSFLGIKHLQHYNNLVMNMIDLDSEETILAYRAVQMIDGNPYPAVSAKVNGKLRNPIIFNEWEQAIERPDLVDNKGYFVLDKGNGTKIKARYNPYIHSSNVMLNDQFSSAQDRNSLAIMEVAIPKSELNSDNPYKAYLAKDSVGVHKWKAGLVRGKMSGTRLVYLTRWDKPLRIVPTDEVAKHIKGLLNSNVILPSNIVTKDLRGELEKLGIMFVDTDNKARIINGEHKGQYWSKVYGNTIKG